MLKPLDLGHMFLHNVDLNSVPVTSLASLASCVKGNVDIANVHISDLIPILDAFVCKNLIIENQRLGSEETRAVVRAMESSLLLVMLWEEVRLDMRELTQYSGVEECRKLETLEEMAEENQSFQLELSSSSLVPSPV